MDLFSFNDDFIAAVAIGHSDGDVTELFMESIRAAADVLEQRLTRLAGPEIAAQARFRNGAFEIPLDQDQYDAEFGGFGEAPQANVRRAIIDSSQRASREMGKVLDGR